MKILALALAVSVGHGFAAPMSAYAAPDDAYKFLVSTGKAGVAQNVGLDATKKAEAEGIANDLAAATGAKAYFIILKRDENPADYISLYERLQMKGKDVLVASNGTSWEVKVAALSHDAKVAAEGRALSQTDVKGIARFRLLSNELSSAIAQTKAMTWNEFQTANAGKGWHGARMSREFELYKSTGATSGGQGTAMVGQASNTMYQPQSSSNTGAWVFFGVVVAAIVGIVLWRRRRRDAGLAEELKRNLANPEAVLADLVLNMDGLEDHPKFGVLMDAYSECENKLKDLKHGSPTRESVVRARSLNDEANRVRRLFDEAKMNR